MEYRRSEYIGEYNVDEVYEGTSKEILELLNGIEGSKKEDESLKILQKLGIPIIDTSGRLRNMADIFKDLSDVFNKKGEEELIYDQEDAIEFIYEGAGEAMCHYSKDGIKQILELEEDYMRSVGIIKE